MDDPIRNHLPNNIGTNHKNWKLQGNERVIEEWIKNQRSYILFSDGASKNNPGRAREGGLILDQQGEVVSTYELGLGTLSNSKMEAYGLFMGTNIRTKIQVKDPIIIGDSTIIIRAMEAGRDFKNQTLNKIK